jgi:hypothetical protein
MIAMDEHDFVTYLPTVDPYPLGSTNTQAPSIHARGLSVPGKHHESWDLGKR